MDLPRHTLSEGFADSLKPILPGLDLKAAIKRWQEAYLFFGVSARVALMRKRTRATRAGREISRNTRFCGFVRSAFGCGKHSLPC